MAITDQAAIRFSNDNVRPMADRIARCYYQGKQLAQKWAAIQGTNDQRFAILQSEIQRVATLFSNTFRFVWWSDRLWQSGSLVSLFPNDAAEVLFDNVAGDGPDLLRGQINGQDIRRLKNRSEEFANWLSRGTDVDKGWTTDTLAVLPITYSYFDDVARLANDGAKAPTTGWAAVFVNSRLDDIVTEYETTTPAALTQVLRCAVNPNQVL